MNYYFCNYRQFTAVYVLAAGFAYFGRQLKGARRTSPKYLYHPDHIMPRISLLCGFFFWIEVLLSPGREQNSKLC